MSLAGGAKGLAITDEEEADIPDGRRGSSSAGKKLGINRLSLIMRTSPKW
jgi:hypothetical protein